jgi:hypothetical protein
MQMLQ